MVASDHVLYDATSRQLSCRGDWVLSHLPGIKNHLEHLSFTAKSGSITISGKDIKSMDTAGAWLLNTYIEKWQTLGVSSTITGFPERYQKLIGIVAKESSEAKPLPKPKAETFLTRFGRASVEAWASFYDYLAFVGLLTMESLRLAVNPKHLRWPALANAIYQTGFSALPIIALLSFMIGVVITYQMGLQLKSYGANIFIVDLLGLAILREFGPLLTAIMVAGRSGSAYTAQLGMMKLNQEIDALDTMGVTPSELLLLPRIYGLLIALPLLTIWADILGILGGMFMSNSMMGITTYDFLQRFPNVIPLRALLIGLGKAPVFALIISSIGCYQGMKVSGGAESVGTNTTRSVVLSIFFIIVADAIFSIIFSKLKL